MTLPYTAVVGFDSVNAPCCATGILEPSVLGLGYRRQWGGGTCRAYPCVTSYV